MRSASAARREPEPPPDAAAIIAGLGRVITGSGEVHGRLRRHERRIASLAARMEACGDADLAALAGELRAALTATIVELISDAAHCAELREQAEALAPLVAFREMMTDALIAEGRRVEAAERDAAEAERARPARHRHRKPGLGLSLVGGTAAAASLVVASAAGVGIAAQDSAAVHHVAASRPAAARFHAGPPDSAVPASWSPSAKPSVAVKAASPAPSVTASPTPSSSPPPAPAPSSSPPPPPAQAAPSPSLQVSVRDLDLTGTSGTFTITALDGSVDWWVSTDIPGASVDMRQGVLSPGQDPVTITVTDPLGESGSVYIRWGDRGIATVWVTAGAPAAALP